MREDTITPRRLVVGMCGALAALYVLVPAPFHPVFPGVPLSIAGTAGLVLVLAAAALRDAAGWRSAAVLGFFLLLKSTAAVTVPPQGFHAAYYPNAAREGRPYERVDTVIDFDASTFPREFFNERAYWASLDREALPFSVEWRGRIALRRPGPVTIEVAASEPADVLVDGHAPTSDTLTGLHDIRVIFVRQTTAAPRIRISTVPADAVVFAGSPTAAAARAAVVYAPLAAVLDVALFAWMSWWLLHGLARRLRERRPATGVPPYAVAAIGAIVFWFVLAAVRTGPHFTEMEFLGSHDDWTLYEATARRIAAGHLAGEEGAVFPATFLYPYAIAVGHVVFGQLLWPFYFAQHLTLALACVLSGLLARKLWGDIAGWAVLAATCTIGLMDVYRWYTARLLSENLMLLLAPLMFLASHAYLERPGRLRAFVAGALLGAAVLVRFNMLPFAVLALAYLVFRPAATIDDRRSRAALVAGCCLVYALFPIREWYATGVPRILPVASTVLTYATLEGSFIARLHEGWTAPLVKIVIPSAAFLLGYPKLYAPVYSVRPHWLLLWIAYAAWIWRHRKTTTPPTIWLLHLYVLAYLAVLLPNGFIGLYGFRYPLPLMFVLGLFFPGGLVAAVEPVVKKWRDRDGRPPVAQASPG